MTERVSAVLFARLLMKSSPGGLSALMVGSISGSAGKALLVEDELLVSLHIVELVEDAGFNVVGPAARLADAVRLAQSEPHLVLGILDVNLAGEKSWPVARVLKAMRVPFVFVTGYFQAHADLPNDLDGAPFLSKPLDPLHFRRTIKELAQTGSPTNCRPG
jgi:CheY-like chemotaxis protein